MDRKEMEEFVANAALLAGHLTRQCEKSTADQLAAAHELQRAAASVGTGVAAGQAALTEHARVAVREALSAEIPAASRSLSDTAANLKRMAEQLQQEQASVGLRMRILGWKSLAALGVAALVVVGGTAYAARSNLQRAERAQVDAQVLEALQHVAITSCDGRPCIKLEEGLQRWEKNDEYVLIERMRAPDTGVDAAASSR